MKKELKIFAEYLKTNGIVLLGPLTFGMCFLIVLALENDALLVYVRYPLLLAVILLLSFISYDYLKFRQKNKKLFNLQQQEVLSLDTLPKASDYSEKLYQELFMKLRAEFLAELDYVNFRHQDHLDYYTVWTHQIKTPIAVMSLVLQSDLDQLSQKRLRNELFRIDQYVDMALQYLRLDNIVNDFVFAEYSVHDIIMEVIMKYSDALTLSGLSLLMKNLKQEVVTDKKWFSTALHQIVSNAIKYSNQGHISIYINENSNLVIEDTGIGIKASDIKRVFEKGFTGYNGREFQKSTGIGLYLAKQIMDALNHKLELDSEVGKGTRVIVSLKRENLEIE